MSLAEDKLDGLSCSWCGVYFEGEHGYPVLCRDCWKKALKRMGTPARVLDKLGFQKTRIGEL